MSHDDAQAMFNVSCLCSLHERRYGEASVPNLSSVEEVLEIVEQLLRRQWANAQRVSLTITKAPDITFAPPMLAYAVNGEALFHDILIHNDTQDGS
jgi:hypothetical protein